MSGFTIVEALFAIFILTFVIVGLMTVVSNSLFSARYARDEITANYLSQEVVDYIRNDRDTIVFLGGGNIEDKTWNGFVNKYENCQSESGCYFNVLDTMNNSGMIKRCDIDGCPYLYYDADAKITPFYLEGDDDLDKTGKTLTKFIRKVKVTLNNDEMIVTVTVSWKNGSIPKERVLQTSLTNWQK